MEVIVDHRECQPVKDALFNEAKQAGYKVTEASLSTADFHIIKNGKIAAIIERKSFVDYAESRRTGGRLKKQLYLMRQVAEEIGLEPWRICYLIEGKRLPRGKLYVGIPQSLINRQMIDGISVIRSADYGDSGKQVVRVAKAIESQAADGLTGPRYADFMKIASKSKGGMQKDNKCIFMEQLACMPGVSRRIAGALVAGLSASRPSLVTLTHTICEGARTMDEAKENTRKLASAGGVQIGEARARGIITCLGIDSLFEE